MLKKVHVYWSFWYSYVSEGDGSEPLGETAIRWKTTTETEVTWQQRQYMLYLSRNRP